MNKSFFLFTVISFTAISFFFSCKREEIVEVSSVNTAGGVEVLSEREEFIKGKTEEEIREDFSAMPLYIQQGLWLQKMDYLLKQNFSKKVKSKLETVKFFVQNYQNINNAEHLYKAILDLSQMIPAEDFYSMFASLENYDYKGKYKGQYAVSSNFINYIKELHTKSIEDKNKPFILSAFKKCNCRWCLTAVGAKISENCVETRYGCGFLFLQPCTKNASILDYSIKFEEIERGRDMDSKLDSIITKKIKNI